MLEIIVDPRRTVNLKQAINEAISTGNYDTLYDDIRDCFTDEQIEQIEEVLESGDIGEAIDDVVSEWGAEDTDELIETLESFFAESTIEIRFEEDEDFEEEAAPGEFDYDEYAEEETETETETDEYAEEEEGAEDEDVDEF